MDRLNEQEIPLSPAIASHFDSCLGCLACVTTCPSGVQYDQLIRDTRSQVARNHPRSPAEKLLRALLFQTFPYPQRLRWLLAPLVPYQKLGLQNLLRHSGWLAKLLPPSLVAMEALLPPIPGDAFRDALPTVVPAVGPRRYRVGLLLGCVQRLFLPHVNAATVRVLTANGCEVVIPPNQGCCGALPHHQGEEAQAQDLARSLINAFAPWELDAVVINASGCGHTLKEYGHLLGQDATYGDRAGAFAAKVRDVQEFLDQVGLTAPLHPLTADGQPLAIAYQDACHMLHGQKISLQPRRLLRQIPGVTLREPVDAALCCGSAGVYNILQPEIGAELGRQKVRNLCETGAQVIASANVGCITQLQRSMDAPNSLPIFHPMELLDHSLRGALLPLGAA
jgi:glycolate oxidase iron-sulfur subunit